MGTIQIKWGDTLSALARKFGTTVENLASINHIQDPNLIIAGNGLVVPGDSGGATGTGTLHGYQGMSAAGPVGPAPSGAVGQWIDQAMQILQSMGADTSKLDPNDLATIIQHESGGDPNAVNNWDSNAAAGHPSKGLMQTIDSTFQAYAAPGHGDIYNPVDNIVAGARYILSRYGSTSNVPGIVSLARGGAYQGY